MTNRIHPFSASDSSLPQQAALRKGVLRRNAGGASVFPEERRRQGGITSERNIAFKTSFPRSAASLRCGWRKFRL
jgi:hypothetical protein